MPVCFGAFTLDFDQRRLFTAERDVPLTPKAFELLKLLIDVRPKALSKDEIFRAIWKDTFVTESTLATTIRDLRDALDDSAKEPRFIRTSYAYGYAFVGNVVPDNQNALHSSDWRIIHGHHEIPLRHGENILGRSGSGVIVIDSATVSRHHGKLTVEGSRLFCEDLGSKNGTWVKSQRAAERLEVFDGDEIRLGSVVVVARLEPQRRSPETAEQPGAVRPAHPLSDALDEEER
jgi:DNA-binding winged helix-turn-helix (wHTH) protein